MLHSELLSTDSFKNLFAAIERQDEHTVSILLSDPTVLTKINDRNSDLLTPLLKAAMVGNVNIVDMLAKKEALFFKPAFNSAGETINTVANEEGANALHLAIQHGHRQLVEYIWKSAPGLLKWLGNSNGQDPVHYAAMFGRDEIAKFLIENGAKLNRTNKLGQTPFYTAIYFNRIEMIKLFLNHGANINESSGFALQLQSTLKISPLHYAVQFGSLEAIITLLERKADVHACDHRGWTPLHYAIQHSKYDGTTNVNHAMTLAAVLVAHGANLNWRGLSLKRLPPTYSRAFTIFFELEDEQKRITPQELANRRDIYFNQDEIHKLAEMYLKDKAGFLSFVSGAKSENCSNTLSSTGQVSPETVNIAPGSKF